MRVDVITSGNLPLLIQGGIFIALLIVSSVIDIKKRIIPDTVCLFIILAGLIDFEPEKILGVFAALPLLLAALFWGGMGGGDIKLMAAAGVVLGLWSGMAALIIGLAALLLFYVVYCIVQRLCERECPKTFPLAPFLLLGCIAAYFMNFGGISL